MTDFGECWERYGRNLSTLSTVSTIRIVDDSAYFILKKNMIESRQETGKVRTYEFGTEEHGVHKCDDGVK